MDSYYFLRMTVLLLTEIALLLTDNRQSVAQRQYDFLYTAVCGNQIIKGFYADGLQVRAVRMLFKDVPVPQSVVGYDITTFRKTRQHHLIVIDIAALVSIDDSEVVSYVHSGN